MTLPFGVSWLHTVLLWACICFLTQKGFKITHGYSLNGDEFSGHAGVSSPQTSNQFHSGAPLNTNQDFVSPRDEMQAMRPQRFVSLQRKPVYHENKEDASSVISLPEEMVQSKPDSEHDVPSAPPVLKYEREGSGYQHPFGLLVKEHNKQKNMEGTSFPTIRDLKQFIETMKRSFLMPGSDLGRHFETAREIMENEMATNAQNVKGERDMGYRSISAKEGTAPDDASENKVWSEAMNTAFEQSEQGANYQMPSESLSVPDPVDSTASLISTSVYDSQDSGLGSALYPRHHLAATEQVSRNYGSFDRGGISGENTSIFTRTPHVGNEHVQSTSYTLHEQIPSGSFFGEDLSFSGHVTASPVNLPKIPSQDFSYYSSKTSSITPLKSTNILQPKHTSLRKDSLTEYEKPSGGFELGNEFQSEELGRVTPANVLSAPMPPSLSSYGKSVYVSAPRGQHYIPDYLPKRRERPAQSFQAYQHTAGKESKGINYIPTIHLPVSTGSLSSSSDNPSPQSGSSHVGVQTSSPHDAQNQVFNRKQPVKLHTMFTVKPFNSLPGSSRHDGYLQHQTDSISHPSTLPAQEKDEEKSDLSKQNLVPATQGSKQMADNTLIPISIGLDSTQSGLSSQVGVGDVNFNSLTNLAPTSASKRAFSRLVGNEAMSRNFGMKNMISDIRGARKPLGLLSTPLRQGISLNGDNVSVTRAGLLQPFIQPTKAWKHPANVNEQPGNMANQPPKPLSASKGSASTLSGGFWRNGGNTKRPPPQTGPNMSKPSVKAYVVKSRNSYVRGKVSLSKTHYSPYQLDEYKPAVSHNVKGLEVQ